jgi:hypothetical protein
MRANCRQFGTRFDRYCYFHYDCYRYYQPCSVDFPHSAEQKALAPLMMVARLVG